MQKYVGILGIIAILLIGYIFSNNRKLINYKLIATGVLLQALTGYFILKVPLGKYIFEILARGVTAILELSKAGGKFVFGPLANQGILSQTFGSSNSFIFIIQIVPTIVFICALVSALYYFHILQYIVKAFAWLFNKLLGVSGAEALANSLVAIVGQVESAIIVQPYLGKMTKSEILTIMTGGMACISGSLMAIYSSFGIKTEYLLAASFMAIPGSFVLSKIFYPEDKIPLTKNTVHVDFKIQEKNLVESILDGAYSGIKISVGVIAMLIAFISLIAMVDKLLFLLNSHLSLKLILGYLFTPIVYLLGIPSNDINTVAQLLGTKISLNEFIAYLDFTKVQHSLNPKTIAITTFLLCGFANFGSIAIQVGGLSQMAPERKSDFAELGFKAMICGALTSCVSGCIVGILL
ncbi:MAG: Na+ dependent nucleoside transporter domain-containing protein [Candidatus Melainabacteria bacterium RIFCSPLOWO2_02_FULL_35_15]|nr:MAG: Na+ dependent nucleoside transporter domain-containing protein [Candidatus Melainabacteria bacterium RIFCSPLOWO2_12_FULL_35_11]OGI13953.1 MAG: Na+ dependent nucleoside transporter domain-containing protein [Candidatus Melainabacteria bacterium RIFCSPLOWO2_02_FULL_35_15]